jgi:phage-related protein
MAITTAISDLFKSFYELIASVLSAAYAVVHSTVDAVLSFITGLVTLLGDITGGVIDVTSGVGKFILGMWEKIHLPDGRLAGISFLGIRY